LELGEESDQYHTDVGKHLAGLDIDYLVTVGERAQKIIEGAKRMGYPEKWTYGAATKEEALRYLREMILYGDTVLVKGSRKMKMETVVEGIKDFRTVRQE